MGKPGNFSREGLCSNAHLSKIRIFIPRKVVFENNNRATFSPYRFQDPYSLSGIRDDGIIRNFPILFRGNGEPWDIANLYLMNKMAEMAKFDQVSVDTLETHAVHLLGFLRWLEDNNSRGNEINEYTFPDEPHNRVTYVYRRYLMRQLRKTPQPFSLNVASTRMGIVVAFYKALITGGLVESSKLPNPPYEKQVAGIPYINPQGLARIKEVQTTDLSIRVPKRDQIADPEHLNDGEKLRPLDSKDQKIIADKLSKYGNYCFELMMLFAVETGARKQTVCTLRIHHLKNILENQTGQELRLKVGAGSEVDIKNKGSLRSYRLHIPRYLARVLLAYVDSEDARARRAKSFYGESDRNYVFLSESGTPFYTSKAEIRDREDSKFSSRMAAKNRIDFSPTKGRSINNLIERLIGKIKEDHPDFKDFRFHDLRATYGMNFVRHHEALGKTRSWCIDQLKVRLGHRHTSTTELYLDFDKDAERHEKVSNAYTVWLERYHPDSSEAQQ